MPTTVKVSDQTARLLREAQAQILRVGTDKLGITDELGIGDPVRERGKVTARVSLDSIINLAVRQLIREMDRRALLAAGQRTLAGKG